MEWPRPQPGHQAMPRFDSGHNEKCDASKSVNASKANAPTQQNNSNGKFLGAII